MAAFVGGMFWHILVAGRSNILKKSNDCIVDSKRYVRALKRRPVKVLYPDSETTSPTSKQRSGQIVNKQSQKVASKMRESTVNAILKNETTNKRVSSMSWSARNGNASTTSEHTTNLKDQLGGLKFERALPGDKRLARVVSVACSRTFREHQGKILLEGRRLICDALAAGANPQMVFFSSVDRLCDLPLDKLKRATLVKVKFEDIKIWSDLVAPQGVIAIFSRPDPSRLTFPQDQRGQSVPLSLICDNVRDPGNLGTILRCAVAAGCHNVLLTKGCVDAWEPKVLRAAMGAHFRLPIFSSLDWDDIQNQLPKLVTVHVADNCGGSEREVAEEANQSNKPSKMGEYGWLLFNAAMPPNAYNRASQVGPPEPIVIEKLMPWVEDWDDLDSTCSSLCFSALSEVRLLSAIRLAKRDLRKRRQESLNSSPIRPQPEETSGAAEEGFS
ncbi:rRNA methyltransferase 3A, mitochondrial-like isoform X3 [Oncorhynchus keta]|uniref:rRNA methyltransferase 3A, mitochondrial-like isoform X3 n=1 Tax=Oncorhynchus keta TaxID=8018 RepID=UPI0015FDBCC5|nr:rRNA methyltransferase 3A, mitochondrial-like isoform X3 [Oncorhynchus keta]